LVALLQLVQDVELPLVQELQLLLDLEPELQLVQELQLLLDLDPESL
jgi:hypothetical protein